MTAVFIACFSSFKQYLNAGEKAAILVLARDRDQAKIVFSYVSGILRAVPALSAMIAVERADEIELDNGVIIMVKTSDFRAIRGLTVVAAILDEVAFWDSEGISPDREVLTVLRPATSTIPGAKLIAISTPYSQAGSNRPSNHWGNLIPYMDKSKIVATHFGYFARCIQKVVDVCDLMMEHHHEENLGM